MSAGTPANYGIPNYNQPVLQAGANYFTADWYKALSMLLTLIPQVSNGGSARPPSPTLYQMFFDTNLQQPIWCTQTTPSIVWKNSSGVVV